MFCLISEKRFDENKQNFINFELNQTNQISKITKVIIIKDYRRKSNEKAFTLRYS